MSRRRNDDRTGDLFSSEAPETSFPAGSPEPRFDHVTFISAGAGSGKTYRLIQELERALVGGVDPAGVIATTFTVKAAAELTERVRERLIAGGWPQLAEQATQALVGTVHSVCERLLKRFAFELGLSPRLSVISQQDADRLFNQALDGVLELTEVQRLNVLASRLGQSSWQPTVKQLADRARENAIPADAMQRMGTASADRLLAEFSQPTRTSPLDELKREIDRAAAAVDAGTDTTAKTRKFRSQILDARTALEKPDWPWSLWMQLGAAEAGQATSDAAAGVRAVAGRFDGHPELHAEVREFIEAIFQVAGRAATRFQALKTSMGLIDFVDMERLTVEALERDDVRAPIGATLELLLVDEFQDTSPTQLALFMSLARLADRVVLVGDVKQAIYAFRGCDPELVFNTLRGLRSAGAKTETLDRTWRTRPSLAGYLNEVFSAAFAGEVERDQIVLAPERDEIAGTPAVMSWLLDGSVRKRAETLSGAIATLVQSGTTIEDPDTSARRPVQWGDIAVLARTNEHVEVIARMLQTNRIPMKMTLAGLIGVVEVRLARACLRRLNDPTDTLATAEIISLADCAEPEQWLGDRLRWLDAGHPGYGWGEDTHPVISRLATLRNDSRLRSPLEIVARVLNDVGIRRVVTGWGPDAAKVAQRQRNLDAFLDLAVAYETHCEAQFEAATLTGFLFWLEHPSSPELDLQPTVTSGNAVHVLTYHRAKGLEWPVVVTTDFDDAEKTDVWSVRVELTGAFDLSHPLANRNVRYWPNLFGNRSRNLPLRDRILASTESSQSESRSRSEARRLAYVGMTRARDVLVIAHTGGSSSDSWLNTFDNGFTLPQGDRLILPDGSSVPTAVRSPDVPPGTPARAPFAPRWFHPRDRVAGHQAEQASPSSAAPIAGSRPGRVIELGDRLALTGRDVTAVGDALHAIIAAELVNPGRDDAVTRATDLLSGAGAAGQIEAADCVRAARRFQTAVSGEFEPTRVWAEYPIRHALAGGRIAKGWIDVLIETANGFVIIDHKSSPRPRSEWPQEVEEYSGQLAAYAAAVEASGAHVSSVWLHFPIPGALVQVEGAIGTHG